MPNVIDAISLYYSQGTSDKEYHAAILREGAGYIVTFRYGRRGNANTTGTKTNGAVDLPIARAIFNKLVASKKAKGYTPAYSGNPPQGTATNVSAAQAAEYTGIVPQLLNAVDEAELDRLLANPGWIAQRKFDGERRMIRVSGAEVTGINRKGYAVALPTAIAEAAVAMAEKQPNGGDLVLDGEIIGDTYYAFDLIEGSDGTRRHRPCLDRIFALEALTPPTPAIRIAETALTESQKRELLEAVRSEGGEGIVLKRHQAAYIEGRPSSGGDALKFKLVATATVRVAAITNGKRSVNMEVRGSDGLWEPVGNVTIPPNHAVPAIGDVVEVRYLYAYRGGALFQPVYLGPRTDQDEDDCTMAQLKYKAEPATQAELVSIIKQADADLDDNLNAHGFDWQATAKILTDAKRELAVRFGKAVGYEGLYDLPPEACK